MDPGTDLEAWDLVSGWAAVEDQAELAVAAEPAGAAGALLCGSRAARAVVAARGRELAVRVVEAELVAVVVEAVQVAAQEQVVDTAEVED